jgi:hypothetical protein
MDAYAEAVKKLQESLNILISSTRYEIHIRDVMKSLDSGLQFTKDNYSELNNSALLGQHKSASGSDIYFYFMRLSHQFFNVMNIISVMPNASYYHRVLHIIETRQKKYDELRTEAILKANQILAVK